jgi:hypothetical protein
VIQKKHKPCETNVYLAAQAKSKKPNSVPKDHSRHPGAVDAIVAALRNPRKKLPNPKRNACRDER